MNKYINNINEHTFYLLRKTRQSTKMLTLTVPGAIPKPAAELTPKALATHDVMVSGAVAWIVTLPSGLKVRKQQQNWFAIIFIY